MKNDLKNIMNKSNKEGETMLDLIPAKDRHKYKCYGCGETRSVKYFNKSYDLHTGKLINKIPYCNKCILLKAGMINTIQNVDDKEVKED